MIVELTLFTFMINNLNHEDHKVKTSKVAKRFSLRPLGNLSALSG